MRWLTECETRSYYCLIFRCLIKMKKKIHVETISKTSEYNIKNIHDAEFKIHLSRSLQKRGNFEVLNAIDMFNSE